MSENALEFLPRSPAIPSHRPGGTALVARFGWIASISLLLMGLWELACLGLGIWLAIAACETPQEAAGVLVQSQTLWCCLGAPLALVFVLSAKRSH